MNSGFLSRLFGGRGAPGESGKMDRAYVSEFTAFMEGFLKEHPEVIDDQWVGREIYWDKQVDFADWKKTEEDRVPEDGYGFFPTAWIHHKNPDTKEKE